MNVYLETLDEYNVPQSALTVVPATERQPFTSTDRGQADLALLREGLDGLGLAVSARSVGGYDDGWEYRSRCPAHGRVGDHSDTTFSFGVRGGRAVHHCFGGCRSEDIADALSLPWGRRAMSPHERLGLLAELMSLAELITSIAEAQRSAHEAQAVPLMGLSLPGEVPAASGAYAILNWAALFSDDTPEEGWILEPLLAVGRMIAIYSAPKLGKSLLMLEIAVAVAKGTAALGYRIDRPRRVLYVDFENDPRGDIRERLEDMGYGPDDLDNLCYLSYPVLAALDTAEGGRQLLAAVALHGCEVVVIDTVGRAVAGKENENDTWLGFYRHTGLALKQAGVSTIRLDHAGKDETKGQRGGSAKYGDVDAVWRLTRETGDIFKLTCEANRMPVGEKELVLTRLSNPLRHEVEAGGWRAANDAVTAEIIAALDAAGMPVGTGRVAARPVLAAAGIKASNAVVNRALNVRKSCPGQAIGS